MTQQPGTIKRLTVAVTVQLTDTPEEGASDSAAPENQPRVTLEQVEEIVKSAVGFDETRSDQIEVLSVAQLVGETSLLELVETPPVIESWMPLIRAVSLGIAALVALVLGLLTLKRIKPIQVPGNDGSSVSPQRARQLSELATLARKNPELMSSILASWINDPNDGNQSGSTADTTQSRNAA